MVLVVRVGTVMNNSTRRTRITDASNNDGPSTRLALSHPRPMTVEREAHGIAASSRKTAGSSTEQIGELCGTPPAELCNQRHYSVAELANLWNLSEKTIRRMFENEPGVLLWASREKRFKRAYTTLRIPETVMLRVHRKLRIAG